MPSGQRDAGTLWPWPGRKWPGRTKGALCSLGSGALVPCADIGPAGNGQEGPREYYALWAVGRWGLVVGHGPAGNGQGVLCPLDSGSVRPWPGRKRPGGIKGTPCPLGSGTLGSGADIGPAGNGQGEPRGHYALWAVGRWDPVQTWPGRKRPGRIKGVLCPWDTRGALGLRHGPAECSPRKPRGHFALWAPERRVYLSKNKEPLQKRPRFTGPFAVENLYDIFHLPTRNAAFDSKT